ncbi:MAG TPA: sugar ABC transporter permease [Stellaceae bacterium]|nr:sugar ABC transporter permease [Stellaceae bacterium]
MTNTQQVLAAGPAISVKGPGRRLGPRSPHSSDFRWAIAFAAPYAAVFVVFFLYPFGYALWMAGDPSLYADLIADPLYLPTVVNTLLFVGLGVNVQMFLALLLSGFFMRRRWWIKALMVAYIVPWLIAAAQACISFHWMLIGGWGMIDNLLSTVFGIEGPHWLNNRWLADGSNIVAYIWKWMPFWTVIFIAGRMTIPRIIYDAAEIDGATGTRRFVHVTFPLMANLYLICTLLAILWALGDFTTVYLVSGGGPAMSSEVLATLGFKFVFEVSRPELGVAAVMSALPVLIPILIALMRRLQTSEVAL